MIIYDWCQIMANDDYISQDSAKQITSFLGLKDNESIVVIGDSTTQGIVKPLADLLEVSHVPKYINLDEFQRPLDDVPKDLADMVSGVDLCFYAIDKKGNSQVNEVTFRRALNKAVESYGGRVGNMMSVTPEVVQSAFSYDANMIKDLTQRTLDYMTDVSSIRVQTPEGTNAVFEFDPRFKWCSSTGFIEKGKARNVMPAEVYTHPPNVNGRIAITGTYGCLGSLEEFKDNSKTLERISNNPIFWDVKNGIITDVNCGDKEIEKVVRYQVFESDSNADRIGEYGMGTNIGIKECLGVMMHDEKYPGVHVAHGHGYPGATGATYYDCKTHFDGVLIKPNVINLDNNEMIMDKGIYLI